MPILHRLLRSEAAVGVENVRAGRRRPPACLWLPPLPWVPTSSQHLGLPGQGSQRRLAGKRGHLCCRPPWARRCPVPRRQAVSVGAEKWVLGVWKWQQCSLPFLPRRSLRLLGLFLQRKGADHCRHLPSPGPGPGGGDLRWWAQQAPVPPPTHTHTMNNLAKPMPLESTAKKGPSLKCRHPCGCSSPGS